MLKCRKTFLVIVCSVVLCVALSTSPELFSYAVNAEISAKIDPNLRLAEGNRYQVVVRVDWNPNLEPIKFNHDAVVNELKLEAARAQEPIVTYLHQKGVRVLNTFWLTNTILIEADADTVWELAAFTNVTKIFMNFEVTIPEDEATDFLVSGNSATGNGTATWNIEKVRAPEVWEKLGVTGENVRVAVTDTGLNISHPDLAGTLWTDDPTDPTYPGGWIEYNSTGHIVQGSVPHQTIGGINPYGHGTATYGIVVGQATGPYGAVGMAPNATGMFALTLPFGGGTYVQVIAGLQWCIYPVDQYGNPAGAPARVSSHSWGFWFGWGYISEFIEPIRNMWYANHFVVASIGNLGEGTHYSPGDVYETVAVGATDSNDYVWKWSSGAVINKSGWDNPPWNWPAQWVTPDLSAPGPDCIAPKGAGGGYRYFGGTSAATPHVAGAAVLMVSANPTLTVEGIEVALKETAVWYPRYYPKRPDTRYGWGRIDAFNATVRVVSGVILDGGFEASGLPNLPRYWKTGGNGDHTATNNDSHTGSRSMLVGYNYTSPVKDTRDWFYQTIRLPAAAEYVRLLFNYHLFTEDSEPYDWFEVYVRNSTGHNLALVFNKSGEDRPGLEEYGWEQVVHDLTPYAGQIVQIYFAVTNMIDDSLKTWCYVDDVRVVYQVYRTDGWLAGTGNQYTFSIPLLAGTYKVVMVGNEKADFDLYAKWNSPPTIVDHDEHSWWLFSSEHLTTTGFGTLYIMVHSRSGKGGWRSNVLASNPTVSGGRKVGEFSGSGENATYSLAGEGYAWVYLSGPDWDWNDPADFSLYIKWNSPPTTTNYDDRGMTEFWSHEICKATGSGTLYYTARSHIGDGRYTMLAFIF